MQILRLLNKLDDDSFECGSRHVKKFCRKCPRPSCFKTVNGIRKTSIVVTVDLDSLQLSQFKNTLS